ncbi:MAG: sigma-70 family RNA polymerase sigma factor [Bacteroidetes bacterium]|jgi:RNA polymerase sigma factor (sigma-70 family)|nr:sigma-70 family RNA polymerase sigma factor [Bacteroidota bacterium]MBU1577993.1 sigma-70 family RNA polymerase sigma factor [Bacteroidota bacterium]MBU2465355.1 sigma-70 family RNA polymerase sigma factor [Bacteroidota bacterium]MBU2556848.1 sigma-70 family RNA polymerase sigma factor [Bacteroidota bacterium]MDA3943324.1 sigma-70 family RNA polymerase sigma factor [Bacteroidota bacterium]
MNAVEITDKELVESYRSGNHTSFEQLIGRHQSRIFSYIMMLVKDKQLADDIFQDTFIKIIKTIKNNSYKEEGKFIQWAMRIAHNLVIDHFRKSKRISYADVQNDMYDFMENIGLSDPTVEQQMITEQIHEDLRKMIAFLPDEQREVLYLRLYAEMSFKDIAELTNVSINTALGRMRYALINMRKMITEKNLVLT